MPSVTIPFIGSYTGQIIPNAKFTDGGNVVQTGQLFINCVFNRVVNQATNSQTISIEKRPGLFMRTDWTSGNDAFTAMFAPAFNDSTYFGAYGSTNSTIVGQVFVTNSAASSGARTVGTITGVCRSIAETIYGGIGYIAIVSSDGTGWFYPMDAGTGSPTFTADTTSGSATLSNVSSFSGLYVGQALSGTGIPAGARIQSMNSGAGTLVMGSDSATATNATANGTGVTITRTPIAKIIDVDFPSTAVGKFVFVDGYALVMTSDSKVYNSALNSIESWGASDFLSVNLSSDAGVTLARYKNQVLAFGTESCEPLYNAGNPSGSPFSRADQNFFRIGSVGAQAIVDVEDTIYFIGFSSSRGAAVYRLDGFEPTEISTPEVIAAFQRFAAGGISGNLLTLGAARIGGNINLFTYSSASVALPSVTGASMLYDIGLNLWHQWGSSADACSFRFPAFLAYYGWTLFGGAAGKVFECKFGDVTFFRDDTTTGSDGSAYDMQVVTRKLNFGNNNRTSITRMQLNCQRKSTGTVTLSKLDDDSLAQTTANFTSIGAFDLTQAAPQIYRCGSFVGGRIFYFLHSDAEACKLESFTVDYEKGVH